MNADTRQQPSRNQGPPPRNQGPPRGRSGQPGSLEIPIDRYLADGPWSLRRGMPRCRLWTGSKDRHGYGFLRINGRPMAAHRLAWTNTHGVIPRGQVVRHTCDNRLCCRVEHLELGSHADNAADREDRNRGGDRAGEANGHARLSAGQVRAIRTSYAAGGISQRTLARAFRVSQTHISDIVAGRRWPDL